MARDEAMGTAIADERRSALDGYALLEAGKMLQRALECEVEVFLSEHADRSMRKAGSPSFGTVACRPGSS